MHKTNVTKTEEEKLVAQLWSDAREKGLAAAVKKVQPAKELFQNLKAEADNAIVKARIADEQDKTKRAAAEAQVYAASDFNYVLYHSRFITWKKSVVFLETHYNTK